jgi:hypothetical protein
MWLWIWWNAVFRDKKLNYIQLSAINETASTLCLCHNAVTHWNLSLHGWKRRSTIFISILESHQVHLIDVNISTFMRPLNFTASDQLQCEWKICESKLGSRDCMGSVWKFTSTHLYILKLRPTVDQADNLNVPKVVKALSEYSWYDS